MESLESRINNMNIDDGPWRQHDQSQPVWGNQGVQPARVWGQPQMQFNQQPSRSPWQESGDLEQGVNEALGLTSASTNQWGAPLSGGPNDFEKQIWSDPNNDQSFMPPHRGVSSIPEWSTGGMSTSTQPPIWGDIGFNKEAEPFWKHQPPQQQTPWGAPPAQRMPGGWPPRQMGHPAGPPPPLNQGRAPLMPQQVPDFSTGWATNGMMRPKQGGMGWGDQSQHRMPGMPPRTGGGGGRMQQGPGRFPGGMPGVDVTVPPPIDLGHLGQNGIIRPMGGPQGGHGSWKNHGGVNNGMQGAPNGGRQPYQPRGGMNHGHGGGNGGGNWAQSNNMWNAQGGNTNNMNPIGTGITDFNAQQQNGGNNDLDLTVWQDPNEVIKKWQRDTGVSHWGEPNENGCKDDRPISLWLVKEGEEEDLETALARCPVPQKKVGKSEDGRTAFQIPPKRPIYVTGWDDLPEDDPNNSSKNNTYDNQRWNEAPTVENPWYVANGQMAFGNDKIGSWVRGITRSSASPNSTMANQLAVTETVKYAVSNGYLDMWVTMVPNLPANVMNLINAMIAKIPALETAECELSILVDSVCPNGMKEENPLRFMNDVQTVEYNRLIIEVTTAKIEVRELSKKISRELFDAGIVAPQIEDDNNIPTTSEDYHYSFLD
ncbi:unnamed protein product [Caenorhabditis bovis]|uniref:Uncharacterized protein n=1 Tax=Caenorhabditis bovis TaxID=2654633 RepID=A0A8S1EJ51_9PELO|nr:unnamed protein product [Caenorhabditis bovis]